MNLIDSFKPTVAFELSNKIDNNRKTINLIILEIIYIHNNLNIF